jgi:hypothetical protein
MMDLDHEVARARRERLHREASERSLASQARAGRARAPRVPPRPSVRWTWARFVGRIERRA